jgi:hypothetical protein
LADFPFSRTLSENKTLRKKVKLVNPKLGTAMCRYCANIVKEERPTREWHSVLGLAKASLPIYINPTIVFIRDGSEFLEPRANARICKVFSRLIL